MTRLFATIVMLMVVAAGAQARGRLVTIMVHSPGLERSSTGDDATRKVIIYLPEAYATSTRRFPVIYLLHGYKGAADQWTSDKDWNIQTEMDKAIVGGLKPMIVVMPDAHTRAGGSFYVNSSADGRWEDFIVHDLVRSIDGRFRTFRRPSSRAIAGHSMGGYGALYISFRHPDVFGSVYALSPCCLEFVGDLSLDSPEWRTTAGFRGFEAFQRDDHYLAQALAGMAIAWSPDAVSKPLGADLPVLVGDGSIVPRPRIVQRWRDHMIVPAAQFGIGNLRRLRAIGFDAGRQDPFTHIPLGETDLDRELTALAIPHQFELYEGDHNSGVPGRITAKMLPFLAAALED